MIAALITILEMHYFNSGHYSTSLPMCLWYWKAVLLHCTSMSDRL